MSNPNSVLSIGDWHAYVNQKLKGGAIMYSSSGSTEPSKSMPYTPNVYRGAINRTIELFSLVDLEIGDRVAMLWGYGLFPPAQYYTAALSEFGCRVYPLGSGKNLPTELKILRMSDTPCEVVIGMPSYLVKVGQDMKREGLLRQATSHLKFLVTGGEVLSRTLRDALTGLFGVPVYDHYGMLQAPMIAGDCREGNCHVSKDYVPEVQLANGDAAQSGRGVLLLSSITAWQPLELKRLCTNDIVELTNDVCSCGAPGPTVRVFGRSDLIIKVRGQQVDFPAIFLELSNQTIDDYYFEIVKNPTDSLILHVATSTNEERLRKILAPLIAITYEIRLHDNLVLPLTNTSKVTHLVRTD